MQRALQTYGLFVYILIFTQRPAAKVSSKTCKMDTSRENDESFDQQLVPGPQERRRNDSENSQDPPRVVAKKAKGKSKKTFKFHFCKTPLLQSTKSQSKSIWRGLELAVLMCPLRRSGRNSPALQE